MVNNKQSALNKTSFLILAAFCLSAISFSAQSNPTGGVVNQGSASISSKGKTVTINQSTDRAVIDWKNFDINKSEKVNFVQPESSSITLNRISNGSATTIDGAINANGNVFIINSNGVLFGKNANVSVGGLIASTADISNDDFMKSEGDFSFNIAGKQDAAVINQGKITISEAGLGLLVAPEVRNEGTIHAKLAKVHMGAGDTFVVDMYGDGLISLAVDKESNERLLKVANSGQIIANGGEVMLAANAATKIVDSLINTDGIIEANSAEKKDGKIILVNTKLNVQSKNIVLKGSVTLDNKGLTTEGKKEDEFEIEESKLEDIHDDHDEDTRDEDSHDEDSHHDDEDSEEETPVEETPVEETPVEETPVEETPVVDVPVVDAPVIPDAPIVDVPVVIDVPVVPDAPVVDVPVVIDVPVVPDAPIVDIPVVPDAPVVDVPVVVDAPVIPDAPVVDVPVVDAPIVPDAPVVDVPVVIDVPVVPETPVVDVPVAAETPWFGYYNQLINNIITNPSDYKAKDINYSNPDMFVIDIDSSNISLPVADSLGLNGLETAAGNKDENPESKKSCDKEQVKKQECGTENSSDNQAL
jgi:filamentous hemagglutinin family protein